MIKLYHNPRCRKSREGLAILEKSGKEFKIVEYLKEVPTKDELADIIALLQVKPIDIIRKNEPVWKEQYKGKSLSDTQLITAMAENPKLIERPIVIHNNKAVIGRPPENILNIL